MLSTLNTGNLNIAHIQIIVRGMYAVAQADEVHTTELVMIKDFYQQCAADAEALASFEDLIQTPFDPAQANLVLNNDEVKQIFLTSCLFLAYADGDYSAAEREKIRELGDAIKISDEQITEIEDTVVDQLMAQFAHIDNIEELKQVAKTLHSG